MGRKALERKRKPLTKKAEQWLSHLIPLVGAADLEKMTLDELAEILGKSKSTLYTYFSTKEEIFESAVQLVLRDLNYVISPEARAGDDMEAALRLVLIRLSEGLEGIPIRFLQQMKMHFPTVWSSIEAFVSQVLLSIEQIYTKGMENGSFKNYNLALLRAMDQHFVLSIMPNAEMFKDQGLTLEGLVKEYLELRLGALRA